MHCFVIWNKSGIQFLDTTEKSSSNTNRLELYLIINQSFSYTKRNMTVQVNTVIFCLQVFFWACRFFTVVGHLLELQVLIHWAWFFSNKSQVGFCCCLPCVIVTLKFDRVITLPAADSAYATTAWSFVRYYADFELFVSHGGIADSDWTVDRGIRTSCQEWQGSAPTATPWPLLPQVMFVTSSHSFLSGS